MIATIKYLLLFLLILVLQVFVLDQVPQVAPYSRPFLFFVFVVFLPDMQAVWLMGLSFAGGLLLDFVYGTPGINASACVLLAYLKVPILKLFKNEEEENIAPVAHIVYLGFGRYFFYVLLVSLVFQIIAGFLSVFSFTDTGQTLLRIFINTVLSAVLIYIFEIIFFYRRAART